MTPSARNASLTRLDGRQRLDAGGLVDEVDDARLAVGALLHRGMGAVEHDEVGLGVGQRAGGVGDLVGQFGDRLARLAGDPAARHVNAQALRRIVVELRLGHAIDRGNDQADARARLRQFGGQAFLLCDGIHGSRSLFSSIVMAIRRRAARRAGAHCPANGLDPIRRYERLHQARAGFALSSAMTRVDDPASRIRARDASP